MKHFEGLNSMCMISSLLLKTSEKFKTYKELLNDDITTLYFSLYKVMSIESK